MNPKLSWDKVREVIHGTKHHLGSNPVNGLTQTAQLLNDHYTRPSELIANIVRLNGNSPLPYVPTSPQSSMFFFGFWTLCGLQRLA